MYHSCGCCDDSQSCEQMKKQVTHKYFEKKLAFEPKPPSVTGNVCYQYNTWVTGIYMAYMLHRNFRGKKSQIEWLFESNLRPLGYFKYFTELWLPLDPSCKGKLLTRVSLVLQARLSPGTQNRTFAKKTEIAFKS